MRTFVFLLDENGQVLGRTRDESQPDQWPVVGEFAFDVVHPDDRSSLLALYETLASTPGDRLTATFRARGPNERLWRHYTVTAVNMVDDPTVGGVVVAIVDVTPRVHRAARSALAAALTEELDVAALATDASGIITAINAGACELLDVVAADAVGASVGDFITAMTYAGADGLAEAMAGEDQWAGELDIVRRDGTAVPLTVRVRSTQDPVTGLRARSFVALDRSQARDLQKSLQRQRFQDPLTGLANRATFRNHVRRLCRKLAGTGEAIVARVALDGFADVNALHGSTVGDAVLREVGSTLQDLAGPEGCVARLYGDVFAVASAPGEDPDVFGDRLLEAIEVVQATPDLAIQLSASIGLRLVSRADEDPRSVLSDATRAAEAVKEAGGRAVRCYDEELRRSVDERLVLRRDLPMAIDRDQLSVVFQPVVRLEDGVVVSVEALLRWRHPTFGVVPPDVFIPLAEQSPVIHDLGAFVLEQACRNAARWHGLRPELPVTVAVNLSASQLADATLPERIHARLESHGIYPSSIMLELTESILVDFDSERERMAQLKATGVRIAIDDFGTGYSSLSRIKQLPLDVIKFDRTFIIGIGHSPTDASIVATVAALADALGVDVIAEGVETHADARALRDMGCALGQGYLWSAPVEPAAIDHLLERPYPAIESSGSAGRHARDAATAGEALRTIKHELASPLAVISMALGMRGPDRTLEPDLADMVARNVERATRLIEELEILDQLDHGTLHPRHDDVDLADLVVSVADHLQVATGRHVDVLVSDPADSVVPGEAALIGVIVTNLVANALKYSPRGEPVAVHLTTEGDTTTLAVHDNGPGIPRDRVGIIWRKFGRATTDAPGSGIGLYLARGIARAHGGDVDYRPGTDGGSTFILSLPHETGPPGP